MVIDESGKPKEFCSGLGMQDGDSANAIYYGTENAKSAAERVEEEVTLTNVYSVYSSKFESSFVWSCVPYDSMQAYYFRCNDGAWKCTSHGNPCCIVFTWAFK